MAPFQNKKRMLKKKPTIAYAAATAEKALKLVKKDQKSQEIKYVFGSLGINLAYDINVYNTAKQLSFPCQLSRGLGVGQFVGDFVHAKSLELRWYLKGDAVALNNGSTVRLTVVRYKEPLNASTTYPTNAAPYIFADSTALQTWSVFNQQNRLNFHILYDKQISLGCGGSPSTALTKTGVIKLPLNFNVRVVTNAVGAGQLLENDLIFFATSDLPTANNPPRLEYQYLFRFTDA